MTAPLLAYDDLPGTPGDPRCVLFVHAFPFDRRMWKRQMPAVSAAGVRAVAPDLRGFGGSQGFAPGPLDEYADDLARLLDHLRIDRAVLAGLSMGGYVALAFARRHPRRMRGLLLADTKATPDSPEARATRELHARKVTEEGVGALFDITAPKLLSPSASAEVRDEMRAIAASQNSEGVRGALMAMRDRIDSTPHLAKIAVPTQVVVGEDDTLTPIADARAIADSIPGATLTVIERAGHLSNVEQPDKFTKTLLLPL